jgi:hypothetical protein
VSFLFLPFAKRGIGETTPGVAGVAFGIEDVALCSGFVVRVIFRKQNWQKSRKSGWSCEFDSTVQTKVKAVWKRTDMSL